MATHEQWKLVWAEDENQEEICDAIRRLSNFSLTVFKQAAKSFPSGNDCTVYVCGELKLKEYKNKASEIYQMCHH